MSYLLHSVINETSNKSPNNIAIIMENGESITYKDLNLNANNLANYFISKKPATIFIGIISAVNINSIISILAT